MMVLIRFWRSLPKRTMLRVLDMKYNIFFYFPILGRFFHGSGSRFFRIGSGLLADPDPDSEKKVIRIRGKKPDPKHRETPNLYQQLRLQHLTCCCQSIPAHLSSLSPKLPSSSETRMSAQSSSGGFHSRISLEITLTYINQIRPVFLQQRPTAFPLTRSCSLFRVWKMTGFKTRANCLGDLKRLTRCHQIQCPHTTQG